jgi:hypothetical protein
MPEPLTHSPGDRSLRHASVWRRYGYVWVTGALFLVSLAGHWALAWQAFVADQAAHGQPVEVADFLYQTGRDTLENWQSEFLQLIWQVAGLALLLHVGSPQSRDSDDRLEMKVDAILRAVDASGGAATIGALDERFGRGKPAA